MFDIRYIHFHQCKSYSNVELFCNRVGGELTQYYEIFMVWKTKRRDGASNLRRLEETDAVNKR